MTTFDLMPTDILRVILVHVGQPKCCIQVSKRWKIVVDEARQMMSCREYEPADVAALPAIWYDDLSFWQKVAIANHEKWHNDMSLSRLGAAYLIPWPTIVAHVVANPAQIYELLFTRLGNHCKLTNALVYFRHVFVKYEACRRHILAKLSAESRDKVMQACGSGRYNILTLAGGLWFCVEMQDRLQESIREEFQVMQKIDTEQDRVNNLYRT